MVIEGRAWTFGNDVSTDLLYPQVAYSLPLEEAAQLVFSASRPGWSQQVERGDIIVGGTNFGMGSSRPAVALLRELGIAANLAESFANLYFRNCVNYALPALALNGILQLVSEGDSLRIDFSSGLVENVTTGEALRAEPLPEALLAIVESGGVLASLEAEGYLPPIQTGANE